MVYNLAVRPKAATCWSGLQEPKFARRKQQGNARNILKIASTTNYDYLMICGDFNLPKINWTGNQCLDSEGSFTAEFVNQIEHFYWFQHADNPTKFRGEQSSCLDLIFTNEREMIGEVHELPPIGKSDHICQKWELIVKDAIYKNTTRARPNFKRADWRKIKEDVKNFEFQPEEGVSGMADSFIAMVRTTKTNNIPISKPHSNNCRLSWMRGAKIKVQQVKRWRCWKKFKETGFPRDYDAYKVERNISNNLVRDAKRRHEKNLIADLKDNPSLYFGHCRRSLKTKQGVNKFVYTKAQSRVIGQEQLCPKIMKKMKFWTFLKI